MKVSKAWMSFVWVRKGLSTLLEQSLEKCLNSPHQNWLHWWKKGECKFLFGWKCFIYFYFFGKGVIKILNPLLFTNISLYLRCNKLNFKYGVQSIKLVISYYHSFSSNQYIISMYFTFISCAMYMGTREHGNFLVKTQLMTNHWEILLIVREGNQKNTNMWGNFCGKKLCCSGKKSLRLSGAKRLRLQSNLWICLKDEHWTCCGTTEGLCSSVERDLWCTSIRASSLNMFWMNISKNLFNTLILNKG